MDLLIVTSLLWGEVVYIVTSISNLSPVDFISDLVSLSIAYHFGAAMMAIPAIPTCTESTKVGMYRANKVFICRRSNG